MVFCHEHPKETRIPDLRDKHPDLFIWNSPPRGFLGSIYNDANLSVQLVISLVFFISPEGSPSRQGISETEFMERIRERMAQEVGGYVSTRTFALFYVYTGEREVTGFLKTY